jgi:hypothetical protein
MSKADALLFAALHLAPSTDSSRALVGSETPDRFWDLFVTSEHARAVTDGAGSISFQFVS